MDSQTVTPERRYELDWLRVIAVLMVLLYHTGMIFVRWDWHVKSEDKSLVLEQIMEFAHLWRMPLLLLVSGVGTYYALRKRTAGEFLRERAKRLLIPFVLCIPLAVAPQVYMERLDKYDNFFHFLAHFFDGIYPEGGNFSWHHLWFVLYLFLFSALLLPTFLYIRGPAGPRLNQAILAFVQRRGGLLYGVVPILLSQALLRPFFPEETHSVIDDWAYFTFYASFFFYGFLFTSDPRYFDILHKQRRTFLVAGLIAVACFYYEWWIVWEYRKVLWFDFGTLFDLTTLCVSWFWVLIGLAYARKFLAFNHPILAWANERVYPFYIWHQAVIVVLGTYAVKWPFGLWTRFWMIALLSFAISLTLTQLVASFKIGRFAFGIKSSQPDPAPALHPAALQEGVV